MSEPKIKVVIPFRDRGTDLRRGANLEIVTAWWWAFGYEPVIVSDGLEGNAQFNRHRAYNRAVADSPDTDVFVFTEADMLITPLQINLAVRLALSKTALVVPFEEYRYLSDETTATVRDLYHDSTSEFLAEWFRDYRVFGAPVERVMRRGKSIGPINVVSRETLDITGGYTEATSGNWYDDNIIDEGFAFLTGNRTMHVPGSAVHLYHLPGHVGDHLSEEDKAATEHNRRLLEDLRYDIKHGNRRAVQHLMEVRK